MSLIIAAITNSIKSIFRNKVINFLSLGIIAFTLLIFGIFNYISLNIESFTNKFSRNVEAIFYFHENTDRVLINKLITKVENNILVKNVVYKSENQSETNFLMEFPELKHILAEFKESPFPSSIEIVFKDEYIGTKVNSFISEIEKLSIVESKQVNLDWAEKVNKISRFISFIGIFLSGILIFISTFIIFNVIKINIYYRKEEISIFKLVGATDWYIRIPFIVEGVLLGFFGSIFASLILFFILKIAPVYGKSIIELAKGVINFDIIPSSIFIKLILLGTSIGLFSSFFSIKKFLQK
ncbi:MAG: permease-like cell division protein FtsX [Acidobacteriota bacterium]